MQELICLSPQGPPAGFAQQALCFAASTTLLCRAYKLGRKRWSYNKVDFSISNMTGTQVLGLEEGIAVKSNPLDVPVSGVCQDCR